MIYCGSQPFRNDTLYSFKIQGDEVIVMQYQINTGSIIVYKSFLRPNGIKLTLLFINFEFYSIQMNLLSNHIDY